MYSTTRSSQKWPTSKGLPGPRKSSTPSSYSWVSPFWLPPSSSSSVPPSPCTKKKFVPPRPPARISSSSSIKESLADVARTLDIPVRGKHSSGNRKSGNHLPISSFCRSFSSSIILSSCFCISARA